MNAAVATGRRLAPAALAVLALVLAPGRAVANDENIVEFSLTNSTPSTLKLVGTELTNSLACWGNSTDSATERCISQPQTEIDPGETATVYVTDGGELFQTTTGSVRYMVEDDTGFNLSGVLAAFNVPITQPNDASCSGGGFFVCTQLSFNQHATPMKASATIVATGTCPGVTSGPCPWSADAIWDSAGPGLGGFSSASAVSLDGQSHAYVADTGNNRIASFNTDGSPFGTWDAGAQNPLAVAADPRASSGSFAGAVYVTDTANGQVEVFTPTGGFTMSTAPPGPFAPTAVAVGPDGRVFALDTSRSEVVVFGSDGLFQSSWGARGSGPGEFKSPRGIAVDASGQVYVADTGNDRIEVLTSDGRDVDSFDGGPGSGGL